MMHRLQRLNMNHQTTTGQHHHPVSPPAPGSVIFKKMRLSFTSQLSFMSAHKGVFPFDDGRKTTTNENSSDRSRRGQHLSLLTKPVTLRVFERQPRSTVERLA
jgi:hypothetical protein